jgi:acetylornithine deacetylase/succinyl-diaminopimelate desuccinylase-like protein
MLSLKSVSTRGAAMLATWLCTLPSSGAMGAGSVDLNIGWPAFLEIYRELVEMNTARSGNCTRAAEAVAGRLKAAGFADEDIVLVIPDAFPKEGSVIARLHGADVATKPILLLAHLDVVEARREDWARDPFKLIEENGIFYGRGTFDDKAMAAVFVDSFIRLRQARVRPQRELKLALTCGEETSQIFNGVQYLLEQHRALIDAEFALNEGADSLLDAEGKPLFLAIQTGEKSPQNFVLEARSPGGHSKMPGKDNALTRLAAALVRLDAHEFPFEVNDATRRTFVALAPIYRGQLATDLSAISAGAATEAALQRVAAESREWNALMRTTCVATTAEAGHAPNALPQRATANVNCRLLPGTSVETVRDALVRVVADDEVTVTKVGPAQPTSTPPPLSSSILGPIERAAALVWPGVPIVPKMEVGATDGRYLNAAGVPTYGLRAMFDGPETSGSHGLNEHVRVQSLREGRAFLHEVVKRYANGE